MAEQAEPTPTRESVDFDHEFAVALFDELMDKVADPNDTMDYTEAVSQYTVAMIMQTEVDGIRSATPSVESHDGLPGLPPA
jgi:hypothetical protein